MLELLDQIRGSDVGVDITHLLKIGEFSNVKGFQLATARRKHCCCWNVPAEKNICKHIMYAASWYAVGQCIWKPICMKFCYLRRYDGMQVCSYKAWGQDLPLSSEALEEQVCLLVSLLHIRDAEFVQLTKEVEDLRRCNIHSNVIKKEPEQRKSMVSECHIVAGSKTHVL